MHISTPSSSPPVLPAGRHLIFVFGAALALRLVFSFLISDTYDYDEFVILMLGRDFSHGDMPYRDFMFFHPPGVLLLYNLLTPVLNGWWQAGRLISVAADSLTAVLVTCLATSLFDRRTSLIAGLLYAVSPLALISAARIGQDPLITMLGILGLFLLLRFDGWGGALMAGICLGLALWIKYPAVYFLPVYVVAAPRRMPGYLSAAAATLALGLVPFHGVWSELYWQTVTFQRTRWVMQLDIRLWTVLIFWILVNPLAPLGLLRTRLTRWHAVGFLLGASFLLTSQVYYHYFVPVVPFAALLGAPVLAALGRRAIPTLVLTAAVVLAALTAIIDRGGPSPLFVTAAHLSQIRPAISLVHRTTGPGQSILADRYEYPYLSDRNALAHYFWNVGVLVNARYLERRLPRAGAVVLSYGASSGFPAGTQTYLNEHYSRIDTDVNTVWLPRRTQKTRPIARARESVPRR